MARQLERAPRLHQVGGGRAGRSFARRRRPRARSGSITQSTYRSRAPQGSRSARPPSALVDTRQLVAEPVDRRPAGRAARPGSSPAGPRSDSRNRPATARCRARSSTTTARRSRPHRRGGETRAERGRTDGEPSDRAARSSAYASRHLAEAMMMAERLAVDGDRDQRHRRRPRRGGSAKRSASTRPVAQQPAEGDAVRQRVVTEHDVDGGAARRAGTDTDAGVSSVPGVTSATRPPPRRAGARAAAWCGDSIVSADALVGERGERRHVDRHLGQPHALRAAGRSGARSRAGPSAPACGRRAGYRAAGSRGCTPAPTRCRGRCVPGSPRPPPRTPR